MYDEDAPACVRVGNSIVPVVRIVNMRKVKTLQSFKFEFTRVKKSLSEEM